VVDRAMLLTSELVTNGVLHAATPLRLTLTRHGGFGLHIVERLASNWGCAQRDDGKTVWFEMPLLPSDDRVSADADGREMQDA
jgi:hypothetical protein